MNTCPACHNKSMNRKYNQFLFQCYECGLGMRNIEKFPITQNYDDSYYIGKEYWDYLQEEQAISTNFEHYLNAHSEQFKSADSISVLEIGSAYGFFGNAILKKYPSATYQGVEISEHALKYAQEKYGLHISPEFNLEPKKYTHAFLWDTIEHLENPISTLKDIYESLNENGRVVISTGDIYSFWAKTMGRNWRLLKTPTHLWYFTPDSIKRILSEIGFKDIKITYPPVYRNLYKILHTISPIKPNSAIKNRTKDLNIGINLYDIMLIEGVKP